MRRSSVYIAFLLLALVAACSPEERLAIAALQGAAAQIGEMAGTNQVQVTLHNQKDLSVIVTNSEWNDAPESRQREFARQVSEAALAGYDSPSVRTVHVRFQRNRSFFGVQVNDTRFKAEFEARELRKSSPPVN